MLNKSNNRTFLFVVMCIVILMTHSLSAQLKREGLIFSEVYLNRNEPAKSWIEIYNPTNTKLTLEKFRSSNVLTTNILPQEINDKGGIEITPGESIILCADKTKFNFSSNAKIKQVSDMSCFGKGGFFSMKTKEMGEEGADIFRYGNPEATLSLGDRLGNFVVPFSTDSISYSRMIGNIPGERFQTNFIKTEPTPGSYNSKGGQNE